MNERLLAGALVSVVVCSLIYALLAAGACITMWDARYWSLEHWAEAYRFFLLVLCLPSVFLILWESKDAPKDEGNG